jgi:uncharacterized caspase-like protein
MYSSRPFVSTLFALAGILVAALPLPAAAESRIALIIGNREYRHLPAVRTAINDAQAIGAMLARAGFAVTSASNLTLAEMRARVSQFSAEFAASGPDTVALLFFAGQGLQSEGDNHLVPVDAQIKAPSDVNLMALPVKDLLSALQPAKGRMLIIMLDAPRSYPFPPPRRDAGSVFTIAAAPGGTVVTFSTAPGAGLVESKGRNSIYVTALLETMKEPRLAIERGLKIVRTRVNALTGGRQVPWESSSITRTFSFFPAPTAR